MTQPMYAILPDRVKAAVIDSLILVALSYGISEIFSLFETIPQSIRIISFVLIFILYDPLFTSFYGGTIGHSYSGIMVKSEKFPKKNIRLPTAFIRFVLKVSLGWISLLTVTGNEKKKAIHDYVAGSIVISINEK